MSRLGRHAPDGVGVDLQEERRQLVVAGQHGLTGSLDAPRHLLGVPLEVLGDRAIDELALATGQDRGAETNGFLRPPRDLQRRIRHTNSLLPDYGTTVLVAMLPRTPFEEGGTWGCFSSVTT